MVNDKEKGFKKDGTLKKGRKMSASSPQRMGAGRVPVSTEPVKTKKTRLKAMSMTYGGESAGKGTTKRVKKAYSGL